MGEPGPNGEPAVRGTTGVPWVDAATPEQVATWNSAAQGKINTIENAQRAAADTKASKDDGVSAYYSAISGAPRNFGAPDVKPFDSARIAQVASYVKSATPWENDINAAAAKYGVSPSEIKMKIAIESGGNPKAVNAKTGATGLGQFMPATAAQYGITDATDPVQSINGIAQMLAANGGQVGGDASKADRAYYGGNVNAKGPNTDQYVENTQAARQAIAGVSGGAQADITAAQLEAAEGPILARARATAEARRPGDPVYLDKVVAEAHAAWAKDLQALKGRDYGNFTAVLGAVMKTNATSTSDLPPDVQATLSQLTPQNQQGIQAQLERNVRAANGEYTASDPKLVNDLTQRLYLPPGDPQKITEPGQLTQYMGKGLNYTDQQRLMRQITEANTPEGNPFLKQANEVKMTARKMLTAHTFLGNAPADLHPDLADEAAYRFSMNLDSQIAAARAAGKDPHLLFVPGSKDYVLDPNRVASFMPTEEQIVASKARALAPTAAPSKTPPRIPGETPAAYLARIGSS